MSRSSGRNRVLVPGSKLDFELEGDSIRVRLRKSIPPARVEDGYGLLRCDLPGERRLADFDVAEAMRATGDDRP